MQKLEKSTPNVRFVLALLSFVTSGAAAGCSLVDLSGIDEGAATGDDGAPPPDASMAIDDAEIAHDMDVAPVDGSGPGADVSDVADAPFVPAESSPGMSDAGTTADSGVADVGRGPDEGGRDTGAPEAGVEGGFPPPDGAVAYEAGTWCNTHAPPSAVDCHDFDEGREAGAGFASYYYSGSYASVTSTDFAPGSPPDCLLVSTPSLAAGDPFQDSQFNDLFPFRNKVDLRFAMKIVNYDVNAPDVSLFRVSYQDNAWSVSLDFQQRGAILLESVLAPDGGVQQTKYAAAQPSPLDSWTDVDCSIDLSLHTLSLSYNGVAVVSNQSIANPPQDRSATFVQIGLNYLAAPAKPMLIYYDDIVLTTP
jgi:hypothetical protein